MPYKNTCSKHNEKFTSYYSKSYSDEGTVLICPKCEVPSDAKQTGNINEEKILKQFSKVKSKQKDLEDLLKYFTELKNKYASKVKQVEKLENAYQKITKDAEKVKKYFDIIIDNYRIDNESFNNLICENANRHINIYHYLDYDKDPDNEINYFEKYGLFYISGNKKTVIKKDNPDDDEWKFDKKTILLSNQKIATIGNNTTFRIYNPKNDFITK